MSALPNKACRGCTLAAVMNKVEANEVEKKPASDTCRFGVCSGSALTWRSQQVLHALLFFQQFFQGEVNPFLAESVDGQTLNQLVLALGGGHRVAEDHVLRNAVVAVGRNAHRDPFAVAAESPVAHVVDGGIGGR